MSMSFNTDKYYYKVIRTLSTLTKPLARSRAEGLSNIPQEGGVIIAPNHISNIDPVLLGVQLAKRRQIHALAKESLFRAPIIGKVLTKMGHVPVHRSSGTAALSLDEAEKMLKAGGAVAIYPEGTIPKDAGGELGAFKSGVARLADRAGFPVVPVGQWGAQSVLPTGGNILVSLLKAVFTRPKYSVAVGEPILYESYASTAAFNEALADEIRSLTTQAKSQIMKLSVPAS